MQVFEMPVNDLFNDYYKNAINHGYRYNWDVTKYKDGLCYKIQHNHRVCYTSHVAQDITFIITFITCSNLGCMVILPKYQSIFKNSIYHKKLKCLQFFR